MKTQQQPERPIADGALTQLRVAAGEAGLRLDRFITLGLDGVSRNQVCSLIKKGHVRLGGKAMDEPGARVKIGECYDITIPPPADAVPRPENIALDIAFEDEHLIVVNKPAGLVVHPAAGHASGTLVNALLAHCAGTLSGIGGVKRPGIVHRLDKDTSGLMVAAKSDPAHQGLAAQFEAHGRDGRLARRYLALVWGLPERRLGTIDAPLARSSTNRTKICVARRGQGRGAVTRYRTLEGFFGDDGRPVAAALQCELETGRTHQIRVHMAHKGHPLMGDRTYGAGFAASARNLDAGAGAALAALGRQALHASHLGFEHPVTAVKMVFDADPPPDMVRLMDELGRRQNS